MSQRPSQDQQQPLEERSCFQCKMGSVKVLSLVCGAVSNGKKDQHVFFAANESGLRLSVENQAKSLHAVVNLKADIFRSFEFHELDGIGSHRFKVNLSVLLECLHVFGTAALAVTSLNMVYSVDSGFLRLLLEESGVVTECEITTVDAGDELDFPTLFRRHPTLSRASIKSPHLKEAFTELAELPGAASVEVTFAPTAPFLRFSSAGSGGICSVDFPMGSESFNSFESVEYQQYHYHLSALLWAAKVLVSSTETYIRINNQGVLCLNHKLVSEEGTPYFVSFIMLPDVPEDEGEGEGGTAGAGAGAGLGPEGHVGQGGFADY